MTKQDTTLMAPASRPASSKKENMREKTRENHIGKDMRKTKRKMVC